MAEFIEREAVIKKLNNIATDYIKDNSIQCSIAAGTVVDIRDSVIMKAPAADVVEVVRCKECKHSVLKVNYGNETWCCMLVNKVQFVNGNHFCGYGERKKANENQSCSDKK